MPQRGWSAGILEQAYAVGTAADDKILNDLGKLRDEGGKKYRLVKNAEASATLALGVAAYHKLSDAANHEKYVYQCLTANLHCLAGIVVTTAGILAGQAGWVQCHGNNASVSVSGATTGGTDIAAGEFLKGSNAADNLVRDTVTTGRGTYARTVQTLTAVGTTTTPAAAYIRGFILAL